MKTAITLPLFRCVGLFASLADKELQAVVDKCLVCQYAKGRQILSALEDTSDVFFILEGRVHVKNYSREGRELIYSEIETGDLFGELSAIDGLPRAADVFAIEDTTVARMKSTDLLALVASNFDFTIQLLRLLTAKSRALSERLLQVIALNAHDRMHFELARLAKNGRREGTAVTIRPAPTHYEIAARVGSHREAVTKELNRLESLGYVQLRRGQIVILDEGRFRTDFAMAAIA
ncbi:Crp/Fnr family transcriptional regulator (plasmid) [Mesorhizobium sp. AR10]|uniref:Crp/Fnr family transcriptional regulator n=1 Tax=Mesorhizobium sp. AR10 TaxID=2865839 RepID=UPI00215EE78A|nr:Crp/Fnr family transcriptional regulator [Mesorhizobium sp. AR10]UVK35737.1 Crp/Fnr family transcriptional regulator [Mesorhizobium sp. AR10]